jgi:hypothetical protein
MRKAICVLILALAVILGAICSLQAAPRTLKNSGKRKKQILIFAQRQVDGIEYLYAGKRYSGRELDYFLGEWHVDAAQDSELVVVLEDNLPLSDVKEVPAMAMKAGFRDVRAFVYWKGTGNMAEVWFGPVMKVAKAATEKQ